MGQHKLKGCRTSKECQQDYVDTSATRGNALFKIEEFTKAAEAAKKRQEEIIVELLEARKQEAEAKAREAKDAADQPPPPATTPTGDGTAVPEGAAHVVQ